MHEISSGGGLDANDLVPTLHYSYSSSYYYPRCDEFLTVQVMYRPEEEDIAACTADFRFENFVQGNV